MIKYLVFSFFALAPFAAAAEPACNLPQGEVTDLTVTMMSAENQKKFEASQLHTFLLAGAGCKSMRYVRSNRVDAAGVPVLPTDQECEALQSAQQGFQVGNPVQCADMNVYADESKIAGKLLPLLYWSRGSLVMAVPIPALKPSLQAPTRYTSQVVGTTFVSDGGGDKIYSTIGPLSQIWLDLSNPSVPRVSKILTNIEEQYRFFNGDQNLNIELTAKDPVLAAAERRDVSKPHATAHPAAAHSPKKTEQAGRAE